MRKIEVGWGLQADVSEEDYENCLQFKWWLEPHDATCYARANVDGVQTYLHRFVMAKQWPLTTATAADLVVDHIDGNGLNNRRDNLRWATPSMNNRNTHPCRFFHVRRKPGESHRWEYYNVTFNEWTGDYYHAFGAAVAHDLVAAKERRTALRLNFPRHFSREYHKEYPLI